MRKKDGKKDMSEKVVIDCQNYVCVCVYVCVSISEEERERAMDP